MRRLAALAIVLAIIMARRKPAPEPDDEVPLFV